MNYFSKPVSDYENMRDLIILVATKMKEKKLLNKQRKMNMKKVINSMKNFTLITWGFVCCFGYWIYENFIADMPEDQMCNYG